MEKSSRFAPSIGENLSFAEDLCQRVVFTQLCGRSEAQQPLTVKTGREKMAMAAKPYYGAANYINTEEAVIKDEGDGRRRRIGTRRTVDYGCTNSTWLLQRLCQRNAYDVKPMRPALNDIINVFPKR